MKPQSPQMPHELSAPDLGLAAVLDAVVPVSHDVLHVMHVCEKLTGVGCNTGGWKRLEGLCQPKRG